MEKRNNYAPTSTPDLTGYTQRLGERLLAVNNGTPLFVDPAYTPVSETSTVIGESPPSVRSTFDRFQSRVVKMARARCSRGCCGGVMKENLKLILLLVAILCGGG